MEFRIKRKSKQPFLLNEGGPLAGNIGIRLHQAGPFTNCDTLPGIVAF